MAVLVSSSGSITVTREPAASRAATSASSRRLLATSNGSFLTEPIGARIRTVVDPVTRSAFVPDRSPPSVYRDVPTVIGGKIPGTEQLAATARESSTPSVEAKARSAPVSTSTAAQRKPSDGHDPPIVVSLNDLRNEASSIVFAFEANWPTGTSDAG